MLLDEMVKSFLYSRKYQLAGARAKARPKTLENYDRCLRQFVDFQNGQGKFRYEELTRNDIRAFVEAVGSKQESGDWSLATRLTALRALRTFLRWVPLDEECIEAGLKDFSKIIEKIGRNPRRRYIPSPKDLQRWRDAFKTDHAFGFRNWVIFSLMVDTGMRIGEICELRLEYLQLDNQQMFIPDGKTGSRTVPLSRPIVKILRSWLQRRKKLARASSPHIFVTRLSDRCTPNCIGYAFRRLKQKFNLAPITPHTLRHAFSTYYLRNGGNLERLRNITGHTTFEMLKDYLHMAQIGTIEAKAEMESASPLRMLQHR